MTDQRNDETLAMLAAQGDTKAFEELFRRYSKRIYNFLYRLVGNRETAEEVTQDTFIKAYRNLYLYRPEKPFVAWLYTIAKNQGRNAIRDRKYFRDISLETPLLKEEKVVRLEDVIADPEANTEAAVESAELEEQAQRVLNELPLEYREVIVLCSIQEMSYKEAASILGYSVAKIASRLRRAKALFIEKLRMNQGS